MTTMTPGYRTRRWPVPIVAIVVSVVFAVMLTAVIVAVFSSVHYKHRVDRQKRACYAKGTQYHYWEDRQKCVLYVPLEGK